MTSDNVSNDKRAYWGQRALKFTMNLTGTSDDDSLCDTLNYLMHIAWRNGDSFVDALNQAAIHFQAELEIEEDENNGKDIDPAATAKAPHHYVKRDGFAPVEPKPDLTPVLLATLKTCRVEMEMLRRQYCAEGKGADWVERQSYLISECDTAIAQAEAANV